jgi:hypothetical protein
MKVVIKQRPLANFGSADCRCCDRLSWKDLKYDKQVLKEAANDAHATMAERKSAA